MDAKLCVTCKWHRPGVYNEPRQSRCAQPELVSERGDKIFGELPRALAMRGDAKACGPDGAKHETEEAGHG